jgi:hypothetical protein
LWVCNMCRPGAYRSVSHRSIRTRPPHSIRVHKTTYEYYTEFYQTKPKVACNSEGTDELPEDGTWLPKHEGADKCNNKLIIIDAFVG